MQNARKIKENNVEMGLEKGRKGALRLQKGSRSSNIRHQKQQKASEAAEYYKMQRKPRKINNIKAAGSAI